MKSAREDAGRRAAGSFPLLLHFLPFVILLRAPSALNRFRQAASAELVRRASARSYTRDVCKNRLEASDDAQ